MFYLWIHQGGGPRLLPPALSPCLLPSPSSVCCNEQVSGVTHQAGWLGQLKGAGEELAGNPMAASSADWKVERPELSGTMLSLACFVCRGPGIQSLASSVKGLKVASAVKAWERLPVRVDSTDLGGPVVLFVSGSFVCSKVQGEFHSYDLVKENPNLGGGGHPMYLKIMSWLTLNYLCLFLYLLCCPRQITLGSCVL